MKIGGVMGFLELLSGITILKTKNVKEENVKIMVFTEGTILGPKSIFHHFNHSSYIPINNSVDLLKSWEQQGAEIVYLTSRKKEKHAEIIKDLLLNYHFPGSRLYYL